MYMGFMEFENTDALVNWMAQRTLEANAGLAPEQTGLKGGDYWARFDHLDTHIGIEFGRIFTDAEFQVSEFEAGASNEEVAGELQQLHAKQADGYMYGVAYSRAAVDGEHGSTHKANMWPIEEALFDAARECQWRHERLDLADRINLSIAFEEWRQHELLLIHRQREALAAERKALEEG